MASVLDRLFDEHLQEAFGERHQEFTAELRGRLRALWLPALRTRMDDDMTLQDTVEFLKGVPVE